MSLRSAFTLRVWVGTRKGAFARLYQQNHCGVCRATFSAKKWTDI